jgi:hypothetical protein
LLMLMSPGGAIAERIVSYRRSAFSRHAQCYRRLIVFSILQPLFGAAGGSTSISTVRPGLACNKNHATPPPRRLSGNNQCSYKYSHSDACCCNNSALSVAHRLPPLRRQPSWEAVDELAPQGPPTCSRGPVCVSGHCPRLQWGGRLRRRWHRRAVAGRLDPGHRLRAR